VVIRVTLGMNKTSALSVEVKSIMILLILKRGINMKFFIDGDLTLIK